MLPVEDDILIARYLDSELNSAEYADLEKRRNNPEFEQKLQMSIAISQAARLVSTPLPNASSAWGRISSQLEIGPSAMQKARPQWPKRAWFGIAATLLILAALWIFQQQAGRYGEGGIFKADQHAMTIGLPDGSTATLDAGSELRLPKSFGLKSRTLLAKGHIYFDVVPDSMPFAVHANKLTVHVRGTAFTVSTEPVPYVQVIRGDVEVGHRRQIINLNSGQTAVLNQKKLEFTEQVSDLWYRDVWNFNDVPFKVVASQIENVFQVQLHYPEQIAKNPVTLSMDSPELDELIHVLSRLAGMQVRNEGKQYFYN